MFNVVEIDLRINESTGYSFKTDSIDEIQKKIFPISSKVRYDIYSDVDDTEYYIGNNDDFTAFKDEYNV